MPEKLSIGGEINKQTEPNHIDTLSSLSGKFNPDEARRAQDKRREAMAAEREKREMEPANSNFGHLALLVETHNKELTPQDAANEYLSLLDELSQDAKNPVYSNGNVPTGTGLGLVKDIGGKYSENPHYRYAGYAGSEAGDNDRTLFRMGMADFILKNEIEWRKISDEDIKEIEENNKQLEKLESDFAKKSRLSQFFGRKKHEKEIADFKHGRRFTMPYEENQLIEQGLEYLYNDVADFGYHHETIRKESEAECRHFFGLDDPERAKKIERAIELRQKYEKEWQKEV